MAADVPPALSEGDSAALAYGPPLRDGATYHRLARALKASTGSDRRLRVAILSSYTIAFCEPFLRVELQRLGIACELLVGGFGDVESLWFDPGSALHAFAPDIVVLALRAEDLQADAFVRVRTADGRDVREACEAVIDRVDALLAGRPLSASWTTLVANFTIADDSVYGVGDGSVAASRSAAVAMANLRLRELLTKHVGAYVWDYEGLVRAQGSTRWRDDRLWYLGRIPVAAVHHGAFAQHLARTIRAATHPAAKVLVLDLDNTVWGGVLGDDGVAGIKVGDDYPGNTFKAVQRLALGLRDRGILLAVSSKNDLDVVQDAFRDHRELLLRWEDFAAASVNWEAKSQGIAAMAAELGLGLDAFVFLDDNPVERAEVRAALPAVKVVDVELWGSLTRALSACPWFDQLTTSGEDLQRATLYAQERKRQVAADAHPSLDAYLASLELTALPLRATSLELTRVAQLFAKTNQFNLTLRRPSESSIAVWMESPESHVVLCMRLSDRFGDHGLIAAAVLVRENDTARIDAFVMSCRVMNRRAEQAFAAYMAEVAAVWGCTRLIGEYIAGPRNAVVASMYPALGFTPANKVDGMESYAVDLVSGRLVWPDLIARAP